MLVLLLLGGCGERAARTAAAAATREPQAQAAAPAALTGPINGWILLDSDPAVVARTLAAAARFRINHIQLSHGLIMNIDEILGDDPASRQRLERLRFAVNEAQRRGLPSYIWAHELPAAPGTDVCYEPGSAYWQARARAYREGLAKLPGVEGVVLQFGSAPLAIWKTSCGCAWCAGFPGEPSERPPMAERIRIVTEQIGGTLVNELHRRLIARTFVHQPAENAWHSEGLGAVRGLPLVGMHKSDEQDWQPYNPPSPTMGHEGSLSSLMELDAAGEYYGESVLPFCAPEYFAWRVAYGRAHRGLGTATRIEIDHHSALGTPNEINLLAISRRTLDPGASLDAVWDDFLRDFYGLRPGSAQARRLRAVLAASFAIRLDSHYALGVWALEKSSDLPAGAEFGQLGSRGDLGKFDSRWQEIHDALAAPDRQVVIWVWQEASEAVELAAEALADAAALEPALDPARYTDLLRRLRHQAFAAEAWRAEKLFLWAQRAAQHRPGDAELAGWMAHARGELARVRDAMLAAGLGDVPLASPARIQRFLEATQSAVPPGAIAAPPRDFRFAAPRTLELAPDRALLALGVSAPARVRLEYGTALPDPEHSVELGELAPGEPRRYALTGLEPDQRYVVRLRATVDGREYRSGYHWLFTPGAGHSPAPG